MKRNRSKPAGTESQEPGAAQPQSEAVSKPVQASDAVDLQPLSRRILSWSGNLLATGVIIILGLTFGQQVLHWWRGDPPSVSAIPNRLDSGLGALANPEIPHLLAFGELPFAFERTELDGTEEVAVEQLRAKSRALLRSAERRAIPVSDRLLNELAEREPVEEGDDWRIVEYRGPIITVVALQMMPLSSVAQQDVASQEVKSVVSWGLGLRAAETGTEEGARSNRWTLFTCSARSQKVDSDLDLSLPLPPGSRQVLAMRVADGGSLVAFQLKDSADASKQFFDQSWRRLGWERVTAWISVGASWHARFCNEEKDECDLQLVEDQQGITSGIMTVVTAHNSEK